MVLKDLDRFNNINLDYWTEMYTTSFYTTYLIKDSDLCVVAQCGEYLAGYMLGKVEGTDTEWHSHISAISVSPEFRRLGVGKLLLDYFEQVSESSECYFADLYVRVSNTVAVDMYKRRGYLVYRTVRGYYSGEEDAYDMRKPLSRDVKQACLVGIGKSINPEDLPEYDDR